MDEDHLLPVEHRKMRLVARDPAERVDEGQRRAVEIHVGQHRVAELEQLQPEAVTVAVAVLVEQPDAAIEAARRCAVLRGKPVTADISASDSARREVEKASEDRDHLAQRLQGVFRHLFPSRNTGWIAGIVALG